MAKKTLRDIIIDRVALVARGSNPHADIVFFKSHPDSKENQTMKVKIPKIDRSTLSKEQQTSLDAILKAAGIEEVDKADATPEEILEQHPALKKAFDDLKAEIQKSKDDITKLSKGSKTPEEIEKEEREKVLKSVSPEVRAMIEKAEQTAAAAKADAEKSIKAANEAKAEALLEKEIRQEAEFAKGYAANVDRLPGKTDDNARLMYRVKKALESNGEQGKKDFTELEKLIKAGNEGVAKTTEESGERGKNGLGHAYDQLISKTEELRKADSKLTFEKAFAKACDQNPELVKEYKKEKRQADRKRDDEE